MKKIITYFLLSLISFFCSQKAFTQTSVIQAQASFIYNFTRYIEWPASSKSGDFVIGVYGSSSFFSELKSFATDKKVGNQTIVIKKISTIDEIGGLHVLFVPFGKTKEIPSIVGKIGENKTIIIGEKTGALELGATINFVISDDDKLKYETKISNALKMGLKCNSVLETMACSKH
jgi:hypothetical protein